MYPNTSYYCKYLVGKNAIGLLENVETASNLLNVFISMFNPKVFESKGFLFGLVARPYRTYGTALVLFPTVKSDLSKTDNKERERRLHIIQAK